MEANLPRKAHQYAGRTNRKQIQCGNPRAVQLLQAGGKRVCSEQLLQNYAGKPVQNLWLQISHHVQTYQG